MPTVLCKHGCCRVMLHVCSLTSNTKREGKQKRKPEHETARITKQYIKEHTEQHGNDYNLQNTEWHAMLAQHENTARHGKQLEHQHKTRHYTEMMRPHQTKHGTTRNKQSKVKTIHGITRKHSCYMQ